MIRISLRHRSRFFHKEFVNCVSGPLLSLFRREEDMTMVNRKWALAAVAGALMTVAAVSAASAWGTSRVNYLTFSGTVALPGVILPAGTYLFEVVAPGANRDVVRVSSREGRHYFMAFTRRVERPRGLRTSTAVTFAEAPAGNPPPIAAWYPVGATRGHEFLYAGTR
jgi:hypothetical protein